jgi:hypothetical protein
MLSLFERFPYGLPSGVFYALLRLTSHAQRGDAISLDALFTQAPPPKTGLSAAAATGPLPPPPQHVATIAAKNSAASAAPPAASAQSPSRSGPPEVPAKPGKAAAASAAPPPATPVISSAKLQPPLIPTPTGGAAQTASNEDHLRPANPFRPTPVIGVPAASGSTSAAGASPVVGSGILGFDPAPNPFKNAAKTSTKLVRPTPVVANAGTSVLGSPSPPPNARAGANPFRGGLVSVPGRRGSARDDDRVDSPGTSVTEGTAVGVGALNSPPLPPRPSGAERPPPPLPPRAANPLIQAGLAASREVRRKQEALPPKTYTVLQSSGAPVKKSAPRLLDGKAPPPGAPIPAPVAPPPTHHSKRKPTSSSGHDPKRSVSELPSPSMLRGLSGDDSVDDGRDGAQNGPTLRHPRAVSGGGVARVTPTYKPKASYGSIGRESKSGGLPSWLREQEELQRSALADGGASLPRSSSAHYSHHRQHSGHAPPDAPPSVTSSRIEFLDNDMDDDDGGLSSEQASRAASIDRNNPFFLRSARDADAQPPTSPGEPLTKLAVARAAAAAAVLDGRDLPRPDNAWVRGNSDGTMSGRGDADGLLRPLGRSKTLQSRAAGVPPAPPRKKVDEKPAQLDSGTYAGFGKPARQEGPQGGGLRLVPPSKKAEVGIPPHIVLERERERASRERGAMHQNPVPPPPPVRRASNVSTLSRTSSSGGTPMSPVDGDQPFVLVGGVKAPGLRERVSGLFGLQDSATKGTRPLDTLKQDFQSVAERHEWLARAAERARGRPISEGTVALMSDQDLSQDAPHVDDSYEEERRREQAKLEGGDRSTPLARRVSSGHAAARPTAHLRRASSNARRSVAAMEGPFSDLSRETGPNGTPREELSSALVVDDEAPGPDVDRRSSEYAQLA